MSFLRNFVCQTISLVDSLRKVGDKEFDLERRNDISSREWTAEQLATAVRANWGIENRLHRVLDVSFGEVDARALRKANAPQNYSLLKWIVLNLLRLDTTAKTTCSLRVKRKRAAWDDDIRAKVLGLTQQ